ncbi:hypothetical protein [Algoriphagus resistens]|uniref:hypothetical protein n=1 Tax=Algoriphagus resistens TaxID=1750590 RepID=UPI000A4BFCC9|nr:hypothetical protein [Algoriphagus resistens]
MNKILVLTLVFINMINGHAQDKPRKNSLGFNVGASYLVRQDLIFSPFQHKDFTLGNFGLNYTRRASSYQQITLNYSNFNPMVLKPYEFSDHGETQKAYPHSFNLFDFDYLVGKKVKKAQRSTLIVGGIFSANIQAMNYVYGRFGNFGYFSTLGFGVFAQKEFLISKRNQLDVSLHLPLIAWLSRSPYLVNDDEFIENIGSHSGIKTFMSYLGDGKLVTWDKLQTFDLGLRHRYNYNDKLAFGVGYTVEFIHSYLSRDILSFRNSIQLSGEFSF